MSVPNVSNRASKAKEDPQSPKKKRVNAGQVEHVSQTYAHNRRLDVSERENDGMMVRQEGQDVMIGVPQFTPSHSASSMSVLPSVSETPSVVYESRAIAPMRIEVEPPLAHNGTHSGDWPSIWRDHEIVGPVSRDALETVSCVLHDDVAPLNGSSHPTDPGVDLEEPRDPNHDYPLDQAERDLKAYDTSEIYPPINSRLDLEEDLFYDPELHQAPPIEPFRPIIGSVDIEDDTDWLKTATPAPVLPSPFVVGPHTSTIHSLAGGFGDPSIPSSCELQHPYGTVSAFSTIENSQPYPTAYQYTGGCQPSTPGYATSSYTASSSEATLTSPPHTSPSTLLNLIDIKPSKLQHQDCNHSPMPSQPFQEGGDTGSLLSSSLELPDTNNSFDPNGDNDLATVSISTVRDIPTFRASDERCAPNEIVPEQAIERPLWDSKALTFEPLQSSNLPLDDSTQSDDENMDSYSL